MKKIILNWLPPSMNNMPSPAMSVLKKTLISNGYEVEVVYWNLLLLKMEQEFLWLPASSSEISEDYAELLFLNFLAINKKDKNAYAKVKSVLYSIKPQYLYEDSSYFDKHMNHFATRLDKFIETELSKLSQNEILYWGFSVSLYQWVFASILACYIKRMNSSSIIVIGGIGTKYAAAGYLKNFSLFDVALWGEGEHSLLRLTRCIENDNMQYDSVPNAAYRDKTSNEILISNVKHNFEDLSSGRLTPDITDYIHSVKHTNPSILKSCTLFLEGSRGCHWRKCHFCYLNNGYKHRLKDVQILENEIRTMIREYKIYNFTFVDNDLIANNWERFSSLLNMLQSVKNDFPQFTVNMAEIITKDIDATYIKRMSLAGFTAVQIGYESASNNLLRKIEKKNTFASNLLFIKFASKYHIKITGANIICGMPEETESDVLEAIENLKFLRFFFKRGNFKHNISPLGIMSSSRYFEHFKERLDVFSPANFISMLPDGYISDEEYKSCSFIELMNYKNRASWNNFSNVEHYYLASDFTYAIFNNGDSFLYVEYLNNSEINRVEIEYDSLDYLILSNANDKVLSFTLLKDKILSSGKYSDMLDCEIYDIIENLRQAGLLYTPSDYSEFISVIDVNAIM